MKNVLITGANKGIGFETARQLAQLGYYVFLGSRNRDKGEDAVQRLRGLGLANVEAVEIDVADMHSVMAARVALEARIDALDILINNAAIAGDQPQKISTGDIANLRNVFDTNYFGAIQVTQQFLPLLKKSRNPVILNVSSEVGSLSINTRPGRKDNWDNYNAYGSSKTALNAFTVTLANEFRNTNFRINSVTPGYTATDLNQFQGIKTVEEGARPIVRLATNSEDGPTMKFFGEDGEVAW
ncbi:SDR family oxidoreductase [Puia dinghuensis]|uniref:Dehydrogenase n=1 Tax=Puia dinghuensis TaxID=1792502 RepID=A0A8J2UDA8_9BACT|nr:SDR family oxidoreductase [Puia dinghuensis]GGB02094.1 dehydrogenase [Puia dinghuensis]